MSDSATPSRFKAPRPLPTTYEDDDTNIDYLEDDVYIDNFAPPSSNIDNIGGDADSEGGEDAPKPLQVQIAELEVQILTAKHALLQTQSAQRGQSSASAFGEKDVTLRSYASEQCSRRRKISKQQQQEVSAREQRGRKRYTVEVDMKGNPCGQNRPLWLTCLRGHSQDIDFSEDNYNSHKTSMLLNIKERVDNTFEYEGGIGRVTEEVFHATLKGQLKIKRYQLKKALLAGRSKPKHIRQDHWVNLSKLISDDRKLKEAERLKENRAQVKRSSVIGRGEDDITTNLVSRRPFFLWSDQIAIMSYQYIEDIND